jgi:hypothetical protein
MKKNISLKSFQALCVCVCVCVCVYVYTMWRKNRDYYSYFLKSPSPLECKLHKSRDFGWSIAIFSEPGTVPAK